MTGNAITSWSVAGDRAILESARRGQEFVVDANDETLARFVKLVGQTAAA